MERDRFVAGRSQTVHGATHRRMRVAKSGYSYRRPFRGPQGLPGEDHAGQRQRSVSEHWGSHAVRAACQVCHTEESENVFAADIRSNVAGGDSANYDLREAQGEVLHSNSGNSSSLIAAQGEHSLQVASQETPT